MDVIVARLRERAVTFGPNGSLVGIITSPVPPPPPDRPVVVVLNAGLIHRVGANRVHVRVGRALAHAGYTVFRFDLSGIGDSDPRQGALNLDEAVRLDIADALEYLQSTRAAQCFILYGLCSGAVNAFQYALRDDRVSATILIDPFAFPTVGHRVRFFGRRLVRPSTWWNVLRGRNPVIVDGLRRLLGRRAAEQAVEVDYPPEPTRDQMRAGLRQLIARDTEMLVIYTGGREEVYNYASQFRDMFPEEARSPRIRVEYCGEADHPFSGESQKRWLIDLVTHWIGTPTASRGAARPDTVSTS